MERITQRLYLYLTTSLIAFMGLSGCASVSNIIPSFSTTPANSPIYDQSSPLWDGNSRTIWDKLQHMSSRRLQKLRESAQNSTEQGWIDLAIISKIHDTTTLVNALTNWKSQYPSHPANALIPTGNQLQQLLSVEPPRQIAILLPQNGAYKHASQAVRSGFLKAYYETTTKPKIKFYDTAIAEPINAIYNQAIAEGADFVIGPLVKNEVLQLKSASSFSHPTLALNYTDAGTSLPTNLYEFGLLPEDEALQMAANARRNGLTRALIISPDTAWGKRLNNAITSQWQSMGGSTVDILNYTTATNFNIEVARLLKIDTKEDKKLMESNNDKNLLEQQRRQDFDVIFLFAQPQNARVLVPLLHYYYVNNIPIYTTSSVYSGKPNPVKDVDLNGLIICDIPAVANNGISDRLYAVGQDAYYLSQSLPRLQYLPNFPLYSRTGALTLAADHRIHRQMPCMTMKNGILH